MDPLTLDDESLYLVLSRRVHRGRPTDDGARQILQALRKLLALAETEAGELDEIARTQSVPGSGGLDDELVFRTACERAWSEGRSRKGDLGLLLSLAHLLDIEERQADRIFEAVRARRLAEGKPSDPALEISDPALLLARARPPGRPVRGTSFLDRLVPALLAAGVLALALVVVLR